MRIRLPFVFLLAPLAEIIAFGLVVEWLGFWRALALVLFTSVVGLLIVRQQGFGLIAKVSEMARQGRMPATGVGSDLMVMAAGLLLLIPGFITDVLGLLLLLPFVRNRIARIPAMKTRVYSAGTYTERYDFRDPGAPAANGVVDLDQDDYTRGADPRGPDGRPRIGDI